MANIDPLNRFAITGLSRKNKAYAVPHEIMVHKEIGQILIKTPNGDIISHDSLTRIQNHIASATHRANLAVMSGDLYLIDLDYELPEVINENENQLKTQLLLKSAPIKGVMISIDVDCVLMSDNDSIVESEPFVDLTVNFKRTLPDGKVEDNRFTISNKLITINTMVIQPKNFLPGTADLSQYSLYLEKIIIRRDTAVYNPEIFIRNILHSIIVVTE